MNLSQLVQKYKDELGNIQRVAAVQLSDGVIRKTPKDDGSAASSWSPSANSPKVNNINTVGGNVIRQDIESVTDNLKAGDSYYLTNGQPYIRWLEYMERKTKDGKVIYNRGQDGHMISRTKVEWQALIDGIISNGK